MRKGERTFATTKYARLREETAAERMLALNYCQVSRRFGHVARVDVSNEELLVRVGAPRYNSRVAVRWYDYYRRCLSEDVITDVPEPIMYMIRNSGAVYILGPPKPSDEEFVEMMIKLGMVK